MKRQHQLHSYLRICLASYRLDQAMNLFISAISHLRSSSATRTDAKNASPSIGTPTIGSWHFHVCKSCKQHCDLISASLKHHMYAMLMSRICQPVLRSLFPLISPMHVGSGQIIFKSQ